MGAARPEAAEKNRRGTRRSKFAAVKRRSR